MQDLPETIPTRAAPWRGSGQQTRACRPAYLRALATAVPEHQLAQDDVRELAKRVFGSRTALFDALEPVYDNAQIDRRYSCQPLHWFETPSDFTQKALSYEKHATRLAYEAAGKALDAAGLEAEDIDAIVYVSSTGVATPTIDARLMNLMLFRRDVIRLPIFGLGCAGGVLGLTRTAQLASSGANMRCLFVCVELCTLAFRYDRLTKSNLVATALFGDGAAAAVITSQPDSGTIGTFGPSGEHCWPDTLNVMGWRVDRSGFDVVFHRRIPDIVEKDFRPALDAFLARAGCDLDDIARPCCHPGGAKVVSALEQVLELEENSLDLERQVLREFGNMSAPTVLFVLERILRSGLGGPLLLTSLGPGFTAAFQMLSLAGGSNGAAS